MSSVTEGTEASRVFPFANSSVGSISMSENVCTEHASITKVRLSVLGLVTACSDRRSRRFPQALQANGGVIQCLRAGTRGIRPSGRAGTENHCCFM
jgi:hypothetical protein